MPLYNIHMIRVAEIERMASKDLRKWLGVSQNFLRGGTPYSMSSMFQLQFSSIVEEYNVASVRGQTMLDETTHNTI